MVQSKARFIQRALLVVMLYISASTGLLYTLLDTEDRSTWQRPKQQELELDAGWSFVLQPLGEVPEALVLLQQQALIERYGVAVEVAAPLPIPELAWDPHRGQLNAALLLDLLYIHRERKYSHVVGLTDKDLYAEGWDFLYGYAQASGHVAVFSSARLLPQRYTLSQLRVALGRLRKVLYHELGHTFGLGHCDALGCVLSEADFDASVDRLGPSYCPRCRRHIESARWHQESPIERADQLYRRGAFVRAEAHYLTALLRHPTNAVLANKFGAVSAAMGEGQRAELAYRYAITRAPNFAMPYYNIGLLFAKVDPSLAAAFFQAGFERDEFHVEALGFMGSVYYELFNDPHSALRYFRQYVRAGGRNPSVLIRYRRLAKPPILRFEEAEVATYVVEEHAKDEELQAIRQRMEALLESMGAAQQLSQ